MSKQHLIHASILASLFIIGSLAIYGCTSVESVTISNISQADSTEKTKVEVVFDGKIDKTQVAEFVESFGTAVAEGETIFISTPTTTPTATPPRRATATSTKTPSATATARPTQTPTPQPLSTTDKAHLWIQITDGVLGVEVRAIIFGDVPTFGLTVIVAGEQFINGNPMFDGETLKLTGILFADHQDITSVYATRGGGLGDDGIGYRCVKHDTSTETTSQFACELRS